jgi:hypothetical protein
MKKTKYQIERFKCFVMNNLNAINYALGGIIILMAMVTKNTPQAILGATLMMSPVMFMLIEAIRDLQPEEKPIKPQFKPSKPKEPTPEEIKYSKILANIDAYEGSGKGQSKV